MKSSTGLAQAGKAATPRVGPRRRYRDPTWTSLPPSRDLIGPPCPLSNLRPVYYAPLFPSLHATSSSTSPSPHPYSLSEFPAPSSSATVRLARVQQSLNAADVEWRLTQYRFDAFNQNFWARTNTNFLRARDAYIVAHSPAAAVEGSTEEPVAIDLAPFYAEHLDATKEHYATYNRMLWKMQAQMLWPAVRAASRQWQWRWETWRAS